MDVSAVHNPRLGIIKPRDAEVFRVRRNGDLLGDVTNEFGPSSEYSYDLMVYDDGGLGSVDYPGVIPSNRRQEDVLVRPARPGDPVQVSYRGDEIRFTVVEAEYFADCAEGA